ncbi:MAG: ABC-F family ATP-binding cassette domain-containing protein [Pseudomonadales bacterium]|nr:ABC-F family ATP-binding cassette domain-containing protein [Pseudomonadales bacterium]MCP5184451.1 ABC-F family ATP-binding cassette domain-containing protein [Pseudomonadales bacterium]
MASLLVRHLAFTWPGAAQSVFTDLNLTVGAHWRTALVGRNGRGKSTLLKLLAGHLQPDAGTIEGQFVPCVFPATVLDAHVSAGAVALDAAGPYRQLEAGMAACLGRDDASSLQHYSRLLEEYLALDGYGVDARVDVELQALGIGAALKDRPFNTLSGGERTRVLLAGCFARQDAFILMDEPTNHLDGAGRRQVADYLAGKAGFILVSHDRDFLDRCTDHVIALNADSVGVERTAFSAWRAGFLTRLEEQARRNRQLRSEAGRLEAVARSRREGAVKREDDKAPHTDKGYIGASAARQMKRALAAERRASAAAQARRATMLDVEKTYALSFPGTAGGKRPLLRVDGLSIHRGRPLFPPLAFSLTTGDRVVVEGPNGVGKSSLLACLCGEPLAHTGSLRRAPGLRISRVHQHPLWRHGSLKEHLLRAGLDQTAFRQMMAALGVRGDVLAQPVEALSQGQRRKLELARSLLEPADLYVWDEPLNYLDIEAREAIEAAIARDRPTLLFVEHDAMFTRRIATRRLVLTAAHGD